ncbi:hypothetical protein M8818_003436 [Zalaria obscura]|uniref:Uncharacterized protein n=1 Tax=Zalaria obscura TaxID=2024903 RepID=A0ACC3SG69_9PEZI
MDCFPDFCLACDKQSTEGLYCSQACRLADLEKAGTSAPMTPLSPESFNFESTSWVSSHMGTGSGFYLPPALDFSSWKSTDQTPLSPPTSPRRQSLQVSPSQSSNQQTATASTTPQRYLSPSSSRSSLTSAMSNMTGAQTTDCISEQARHELSGYVSSFDQTREWKRRSLQT